MGGVAAAGRITVVRRARLLRLGAAVASRLSVRTHVVGLILVIVAPLLAFSAFLVLRSATHEEDFMAATARERSREAAATIDHELGSLRTRLLLLAGSRSLQSGDLEAFRADAIQLVKQDDMSLVLLDPSGQEVINTRAPSSAILPVTPDKAALDRVIATGMPKSPISRGMWSPASCSSASMSRYSATGD